MSVSRAAVATICVELLGVLVVGSLSIFDAKAFPQETVWSLYGRGYGFVPLLLPLVWLVLFVLACRWFTRRPTAVALLPVLAAVVWFAALLGPTLVGQA